MTGLDEVRALMRRFEAETEGEELAGARDALRDGTAVVEQAHAECAAMETERDTALLELDQVRAATDATSRRLAETLVALDGMRASVLAIAAALETDGYPQRARLLRAAVQPPAGGAPC